MWGRIALAFTLLAGCDRVFGLGDPYEDAAHGIVMPDVPTDNGKAPPVDVMIADASLAAESIVHLPFDADFVDDQGRTLAACVKGTCDIVNTSRVGMGALQLASNACMKVPLSEFPLQFTIALWANPTSSAEQTMISKAFDSSLLHSVWRLHGSGSIDGFGTYNGTDQELSINEPLVASTWQHFAITYDGSHLRSYYNGLASDMYPVSIPSGSAIEAIIGCDVGQSTGYFTGKIDDLYIFDRALTAEEVASLDAAQ